MPVVVYLHRRRSDTTVATANRPFPQCKWIAHELILDRRTGSTGDRLAPQLRTISLEGRKNYFVNHPMPLIGLTGRRGSGAQLGAPGGFSDAPVDLYLSEYAIRIVEAGGLPIHLPLDARPTDLIMRLDGLVLAGGEDVSPEFYRQKPSPSTGPCSAERDQFEFALTLAAIERSIPVLGICRGAQVLNVLRGGTLIQHLPRGKTVCHEQGAKPRIERDHDVQITPNSILGQIYGARPDVNTFHHQAIDIPGHNIRVTATAPDGLIEGIEFDDAPVIAVQWHPEVFADDPIFRWLLTDNAPLKGTRNFSSSTNN